MARKGISMQNNPLLGGPTLVDRGKGVSPYREIRISEIDVDPNQPRRVFEAEALAELAESVKTFGILSPILVRMTDSGRYMLIAGERRLRAAKMVGLNAVPAIIDRDDGDQNGESVLPKQLVENLQREDLSPLERAVAIGQLRDRFSLSIREIAQKLGISKSLVQRSLQVLEMPDDLQAALAAGASEAKVLILAQIDNRESRKALLSQIDSLSRAQLEDEVAKLVGLGQSGDELSHSGTDARKTRSALSIDDIRLIEEIQKSLGSRVAMVRSRTKPERGRLTLEFYSSDDLVEIYRRLVGS